MNGRRDAERWGRLAELIALVWLMAKGYRVLARRARTPFGEVDLAALKRHVLIIVEVKARPTLAEGLEAVSPRQQERLMRAGAALAGRWRLSTLPMRMDLIVVRPWRAPIHRRAAWREGDWRA